eukprot:5353070-Amphidinium_carterae.1
MHSAHRGGWQAEQHVQLPVCAHRADLFVTTTSRARDMLATRTQDIMALCAPSSLTAYVHARARLTTLCLFMYMVHTMLGTPSANNACVGVLGTPFALCVRGRVLGLVSACVLA